VSYRICCGLAGLAGESLRVYFLMARDGDADAFFYGSFGTMILALLSMV